MDDIVKKIATEYDRKVRNDLRISAIQKSAKKGYQKLIAAQRISTLTGMSTAEVLLSNLLDLYPDGAIPEEVAKALIVPTLRKNYDFVSPIAESAHTAILEDAGIGLKPVVPAFDANRAEGIAVELSKAENVAEHSDLLRNQIINNSINIVDESTRQNVQTQSRVGLEVRVIRIYDGRGLHYGKTPCEWCIQRVGEWEYRDALANGVFERHTGCECDLYYKTVKGDWQHGWQKYGGWDDVSEETIQNRRKYAKGE